MKTAQDAAIKNAPKRQRMSAEQRREQLLDSALELAATGDFGLVTIDAVASKAGTTRTLIYHQFGTREGLLEALIDRETRRAMDQLAAVFDGLSSAEGEERLPAEERVAHALFFLFDAVSKNRTGWQLLLSPPAGAPASLHKRVDLGRSRAITFFHDMSVAFVKNRFPDLPPTELELELHLTGLKFEELLRLYQSDPERYNVEQLMNVALRTYR